MNWKYRLWQFWSALWAKQKVEDQALVYQLLTPELARLFFELQRSEQVHALRVCQKLMADGESDPLLLQAALLHDIGKIRYRLRLWERVWIVLYEWFTKRIGMKAGLPERALESLSWWQRPLCVGKVHPHWGAELLRRHGVDERVVWLVQHHQEKDGIPPSDPRASWLQKLVQADQVS